MTTKSDSNTSDSCFSACKHFLSSCFVLVFSASSSAVNSLFRLDNSTIFAAAGPSPPAPAACTVRLSCSFFWACRSSTSRSPSSLYSRPVSSFSSLSTQTTCYETDARQNCKHKNLIKSVLLVLTKVNKPGLILSSSSLNLGLRLFTIKMYNKLETVANCHK